LKGWFSKTGEVKKGGQRQQKTKEPALAICLFASRPRKRGGRVREGPAKKKRRGGNDMAATRGGGFAQITNKKVNLQ